MSDFLEKYKKQLTYGVGALVLCGACYQMYNVIANKPVTEKVIPIVRTVTVGTNDSANSSVYPGAVHGRYESNLAFQVGGKINARLVNLGDKVKAGQVLMTLDPKDVSQNVEATNAALAAAISNQRLAQANAERYRQLYAQGAASKLALDNYNTQLDAANATLRQAQAQANAAGNQMDYTQLKSDADGVVAALTGEVGMVTGAGAVMATVVRDNEQEIRINVPESALGKLKIGQEATVSFWALEGTTVKGHIRDIGSMADATTKTYRVNVALDAMPAAVKLGMTAKVSFIEGTANASLIIPASAIYKTDNKTQVWLVKDNCAILQPVTVAQYKGNDVEISSGLNNGDVVVTAGISKLIPQQEVRLMDKAAQGGEKK